MIRLIIPKEPSWLELVDDVRIRVRPVTKIEQAAARAYAQRKQSELTQFEETAKAVGGLESTIPDPQNPDLAEAASDLLYAQGLARLIILEWEGVLDEAGEPAEVTDEAIDQFMRLPYIGDLFVAKVQETLTLIFSEGNASAPAPDGSSAAGESTATPVSSTTSPAAGESPDKTASDAPSSNTSSKQTPAGRPSV